MAEWKDEDAVRAGIEGTLSEGVRGFGRRRDRSLGLAKAHRQHVITAAAMDRSRWAAWRAGETHGGDDQHQPDRQGPQGARADGPGDGPGEVEGAHRDGPAIVD